MPIKPVLAALVCCFGFLMHSVIHADEDNLSSVWFTYSEDEDDVRDVLVDLNIGLDPDNTLTFRAGETTSPFFSQEIRTRQYYLGLNTFEFAPWSLDIGYEYWGKSKELVYKTLQFGAHWNSDDWSLGLNLEYRELDFYTRVLQSGQYKYEMESVGYGPSVQIYQDRFSLGMYAMWYDYSDDPATKLNNLFALFVLGAKTWSQVSALNDWYAGGQIQYDFAVWRLGMNYSHSVAALDQAESDSIAVFVGIDLTKDVHAELEFGRVYTGQDVTTNFVTVGLGIDF